MDTDPTKHGPTYRRAQQSYALQVSGYKICKMDFFLMVRLGHDLDNPYVQDDDLKHMTMATSAIRKKQL